MSRAPAPPKALVMFFLVRLGNPGRQYQAPSYSSPGPQPLFSPQPSTGRSATMHPDHPGGLAPKLREQTWQTCGWEANNRSARPLGAQGK